MKQHSNLNKVMVTERSRSMEAGTRRLQSVAGVKNGAGQKSRMIRGNFPKKTVCLCFFLFLEAAAVTGQQIHYVFNTKKHADEYAASLRENWGIASETGLSIEQSRDRYKVYLLPIRKVNGMPVLRDDFATEADAGTYRSNLMEEMGISVKIIHCGKQQYGAAIDVSTLNTSESAGSSDTLTTNAAKVSGKYIVVAGSFTKRSDAEARGRELNSSYGYDIEIISAAVKGGIWYRVSVFSCHDKREADRFVKQWEQKHNCKKCVWYYLR